MTLVQHMLSRDIYLFEKMLHLVSQTRYKNMSFSDNIFLLQDFYDRGGGN